MRIIRTGADVAKIRRGEDVHIANPCGIARSFSSLATMITNMQAKDCKVTLPPDYLPPDMLPLASYMEREFARIRSQDAAQVARARGRTMGGPTIGEEKITYIKQALARGESPSLIAARLGVSRATVYRHADD